MGTSNSKNIPIKECQEELVSVDARPHCMHARGESRTGACLWSYSTTLSLSLSCALPSTGP